MPLLVLLATISAASAAGGCAAEEFGVDFDGGDIQPLGTGFRNATSAGDCCSQCSAVAGCLFFSFAPKNQAFLDKPIGPPHNCWLKSSFGARVARNGRTSGGVGPLPPAPPAWPDACNGAAGCPLGTNNCPWCDVSATVAQRVAALAGALTLDEKIQQISTFTPKTVPGVPRVGLPPFSYHSEGLHGLRNAGHDTLGLVATLFPQTTGMAATANMSLVRDMASVMRTEARALWNEATRRGSAPFSKGAGLFYWSPTMNLGRDPRWGR